MWFTAKKQTEQVIEPKKKVEDLIVETFKIGTTVEYLGVKMIVTGHFMYNGSTGYMSGLAVDYLDGLGAIKSHWFCQREVVGLFMQ